MSHIYQNDFGTLYSDHVTLRISRKKRTFQTRDIVKIRFIKRKTYCLNYAFLLAISIFHNILHPSSIAFATVLTFSILLLVSFYLKFKQHKIIIIKRSNFIKIDVEKKFVRDAENLIKCLKQLKRI